MVEGEKALLKMVCSGLKALIRTLSYTQNDKENLKIIIALVVIGNGCDKERKGTFFFARFVSKHSYCTDDYSEREFSLI